MSEHKTKKITVVFSTDENYASHCATALFSLLRNLAADAIAVAYVIHAGDLSQRNLELLAEFERDPACEINFLTVDQKEFGHYPLNRPGISQAAYYRLKLHEMLPEEVKRVIYLDCDTIVEDDLSGLFDLDMRGCPIAGAPDEGGITQSERLGLDLTHDYFNSGVLLMDLEKLRACAAEGLYIQAFEQNAAKITMQDQDILNIAFAGKSLRLHLRYNANSRIYKKNHLKRAYSEEEAAEAAANPAIIHYTDRWKPWIPAGTHPKRNRYWHYRQQTAWRVPENELAKAKRRAEKFGYSVEEFDTVLRLFGLKFKIPNRLIKPIYLKLKKLKGD